MGPTQGTDRNRESQSTMVPNVWKEASRQYSVEWECPAEDSGSLCEPP